MRKIREILRLKNAGLSNRAISRACKVSNSTVGEYLRRAKAADVHWPLPPEIGEEEILRKLFPEETEVVEKGRPLPDCESIQKELKKKGITLRLFWEEYQGQHPENPVCLLKGATL